MNNEKFILFPNFFVLFFLLSFLLHADDQSMRDLKRAHQWRENCLAFCISKYSHTTNHHLKRVKRVVSFCISKHVHTTNYLINLSRPIRIIPLSDGFGMRCDSSYGKKEQFTKRENPPPHGVTSLQNHHLKRDKKGQALSHEEGCNRVMERNRL